jgi:hypothetical protein
MSNSKVDTNEQSLWRAMADLTIQKCRQKCKSMGSCCDGFYCDIAKEMATSYNITLQETGNKIPFLNDDGVCVVPPYLRPMCTLQQCEISGIGICADDPEWTKEYFTIREQLDKIGFDENSGMW